MSRRANVGRFRWGIAFVLIAVLGMVTWSAVHRSESDIEDLLNAHATAWEAADGLAASALYVPTGRFVY